MTITDADVAGEFTHLFCAPVTLDPVCAECGTLGRFRDHGERRVTDLPIVGHPTRLHVRVPRFTCDSSGCSTRIFQQRLPALAEPRAKTSRRCTRWILQRLAIDRTSVPAVAKALGLGWDLVNETTWVRHVRSVRLSRGVHPCGTAERPPSALCRRVCFAIYETSSRWV